MVLNAVLLPPFLEEAAIFDGETAVANLLKVSVKCIAMNGAEKEDNSLGKVEEYGVTIEGGGKKDKREYSAKESAKMLATIADYS